jgi:hypothetical protein
MPKNALKGPAKNVLDLCEKFLLSPFCGITKEMMFQGPQVADMEYQETTRPTMSTCTDGDPPHHHNSRLIMTVSTVNVLC